jgi:O-antigen/teichoic acid export membrane protein/peptidoglycan/xylan/chitin deacetylase (PgdA/CDA1 family)
MYHRVAKQSSGVKVPTWNVTPNKFEEQLSGLVASGFRAIALRDLLESAGRGEDIPNRTFVVTFDDGYENVYLEAWPLLRRLQIPATIFLATSYLDSDAPFPFDDWQQAGVAHVPETAWRPLTTAQCREMVESGLIELGAHTHTHVDFRGNPRAFEHDLRKCMAVLQDRFGVTEATFAFPFGVSRLGYEGHEFIDAVKQLGILCALTTEPQLVRSNSDRYSWGRFEATQADTAITLAACLDGRYEMVRRWRPDRVMKRITNSLMLTLPSVGARLRNAKVSDLVPRLWTTLSRVPSFRSTSLGITDQAIVGAAGFLTSVMVGRWGSKEELGNYQLILSALLFARGIQQTATSMPYVVYWSRNAQERRDSYAGSCLSHQLIIAVLTSIAFLCLAAASRLGIAPRELASSAVVMIVFGPALLLREYLRQLSFAHVRMAAAVQLDATVTLVQVVGLLLMAIAGILSAASAYVMIGVACIVACIVWFAGEQIRFRFVWSDIWKDWKWNWRFGQWALAGQVTGSIVPTVIPWALGYFHGVGETGLLGAGFSLVGACNILVMGVDNVLTPRAVDALVQGGQGALWTVVRNTSIGLFVVLAVFLLFSLLAGEFMVVALFGPQFKGGGVVMATLALALLINSLAMTASAGLYALEQTRANFVIDLIAALLALSAAVFLIELLGAFGAAITSVVAAVVAATGKYLVLMRLIKNFQA